MTVPNAVLLSTIGILETDPLLNTNIPGLPWGSPSNMVYSMMEFNMDGPIVDFRVGVARILSNICGQVKKVSLRVMSGELS